MFKFKKTGWALAIVLLTILMMLTVFQIIDLGYPGFDNSNLEILLEVFNEDYTSRGDLVMQLLLSIGVLMLIFRSDIRSFFEVSRKDGLKIFWLTLVAYVVIGFKIGLF